MVSQLLRPYNDWNGRIFLNSRFQYRHSSLTYLPAKSTLAIATLQIRPFCIQLLWLLLSSARVADCSGVYVALWKAVWGLKHFLMGDPTKLEVWQYMVLLAPPLAVGALTSFGSLDLDFGSGFFHYSLYLVICVLMRLAMKLPVL